jgi:methylglutamate dehydrogenase subunit C
VSAQPYRLATGGLIDRKRPCHFRFDGREYTGFAGDTLASALLANGVSLVGRSFKYHRPRGLLSSGAEEPNALIELRRGAAREPNTRATTIELFDGLEAQSQNRWPSLGFDLLSLNRWAAPFLGAGFYYKTFMWPASFWEKVYEPLIRRAAGLGRAAGADDPDHYEKSFAHCDILVIGAGPAGLMAALTAGRAGARIILANEDFAAGGQLHGDGGNINGTAAAAWVNGVIAELAAMPHVQIMPRTTIYGVYDGATYGAVERVNDHLLSVPAFEPRQRHWRIHARRAVLASGAGERPLMFANNDLPGIMLASAARTYLQRFAVKPAGRVVIATSCDDGWASVDAALAAGVAIAAIVDTRSEVDEALLSLGRRSGAAIYCGGDVVKAHGGHRVGAITIRNATGSNTRHACDGVWMSGGFSPLIHLTSHLGARPQWDEQLQAFVPGQNLPAGLAVAGAACGDFALGACIAAGQRAGIEAAQACGFSAPAAEPILCPETSAAVGVITLPRTAAGPVFVDFQNDVTAKDIALAAREGYSSPELAKRYTTLGMATDQGKTANINGMALLAAARGKSIAQTGTTVYRPPYTPVSFGALAGHHRSKDFRATRLTPAHHWAQEQGAVFMEAGAWMRAAWFPKAGESDWVESVIRETKATRSSVGLCDVSTLGKIDIQGADAGVFLDRVYCNTFSTLAVGRARYGLMLREDGFVMDDGTTSRLAPAHFLMTTTTSNASKVMQHLEFCHQALWPDLDLHMVSVSEHWAQYSLAGPRSRDVLQRLVDRQHDISNEAFPYMGAREITISGGLPARLYRISFSGELAYELAVPARYGDATVRALMAAGGEFGITPYGLETLNAMRIEKGHVTGSELNGTTTARDLGLGRMMSTKKHYIGRVMEERPALRDERRWQLVGLKPVDRSHRLKAGGHLVGRHEPAVTANDQGYVTSASYSPMLEQWIGLGLLSAGDKRHGEIIRACDLLRQSEVEVEVCNPVFFDPKGERLHG